MKRYPVIALMFAVACLFAVPRAFADKDKDKDPDKKKETKSSSSHSGSSGSSGSTGSSGSSHDHSSGHGSHSEGSGSSGSSGTSGTSSGTSGTSGGGSSDHTTTSTDTHRHASEHTADHTADHKSESDGTHGQGVGTASGDHASSGHGSHSGSTGGDTSHGSSTHDRSTDSSHSHSWSGDSQTHGTHDAHVEHRVDARVHVTVDHDRLTAALHVHPGKEDRDHAFEHSRLERARFERHIGRIHFVPAHRVILSRIRIVPSTYHYRRTVFYDVYGWTPRPYVFGLYPRYGLWDVTFLAFALDHAYEDEYALMFYHHRHDAEIEQWMEDNDRLAEENDELRDELASMRSQMDRLEDSGLAVDPSYVPADAEDVALAPEVIDQLTSGGH